MFLDGSPATVSPFGVTPFLMGKRPGTGDFGLFGQLSQLVQVEPSSQVLSREIAPRVIPWCDCVEDLSGLRVEGDGWFRRHARGGRPAFDVVGIAQGPTEQERMGEGSMGCGEIQV